MDPSIGVLVLEGVAWSLEFGAGRGEGESLRCGFLSVSSGCRICAGTPSVSMSDCSHRQHEAEAEAEAHIGGGASKPCGGSCRVGPWKGWGGRDRCSFTGCHRFRLLFVILTDCRKIHEGKLSFSNDEWWT